MMGFYTSCPTILLCLLAFPSYPTVNSQSLEDLIEDADVRELTLQFRNYCPRVALCNEDVMDVINVTDVSNRCCMQCSCDAACMEAGECCPDVLPEVPQVPEHPPLEQCIRLTYLDDEMSAFNYFRVIAGCPPDYPDSGIASMCVRDYSIYNFADGITGFVPVTDGITGLTYKNLHCLRCNDGNESALIYWDVEIACPLTFGYPITFRQYAGFFYLDACNVMFESPTFDGHALDTFIHPSICLNIVNECNVTGDVVHVDEQTEKFCHAYTSIYKNFINVHCALCNGVSETDILNDDGCEGISAPLPIAYRDTIDIHGLVAAEEWGKTSNLSTERASKPEFQDCIEASELFMTSLQPGFCVSRHCQKPQYLHGAACRPVYREASGYPVKLSMRFYPLHTTRLEDVHVQTFTHTVQYVLDEFAKRPGVKNYITDITYDLLVKIDEGFELIEPPDTLSEGDGRLRRKKRSPREGGGGGGRPRPPGGGGGGGGDGGEQRPPPGDGGGEGGEGGGGGEQMPPQGGEGDGGKNPLKEDEDKEERINDKPKADKEEDNGGPKVLYLELQIRILSNNVDDVTAFVEACNELYDELDSLEKYQLEYIGSASELLNYLQHSFVRMAIDLSPELQSKFGVTQAVTDGDGKLKLVLSKQYVALSTVEFSLVSHVTFCSQVVLNASRFQRDVTGNGSVKVHVEGRRVTLSMVVFENEYNSVLMCENDYEDLFESYESLGNVTDDSSCIVGFSRVVVLGLAWMLIQNP